MAFRIISLFQSFTVDPSVFPRGDALRSAQRLPLANIFCAFGAANKRTVNCSRCMVIFEENLAGPRGLC